jgi:carbonic anhydrase
MKRIIEGLTRFQTELYPNYAPVLRDLAGWQQPEALFITCSDSRLLPALYLQCEPGDLFICRNAGNVVPAYEDESGGVAATVEYAVKVLRVRDIIICGHSDCGAMKAVVRPELTAGCPAVARWLAHADGARRAALSGAGPASEEDILRRVTEQNVIAQLEHLSTHPSVDAALARGELDLYGWYFDIPSGSFFAYDPEQGRFSRIRSDVAAAAAQPRWRRASPAA